jgi:hypothetical protein
MNSSNSIITNGSVIEVDSKKANKILSKLIVLESDNIRTKKYNDSEMVRKIRKMIEEEVKCY